VAGVAAAVVAADQVTKTLALEGLADGPIDLVWTLRLNLTFNTGASFSLGRGFTPWLVVAGVVSLVALLFFGRKVSSRPMAVALGLVLGGAVGNLTDRLFRGHGGAVIDFIDLQWWPVFNVADIGISLGAIGLIITAGRERQPEPEPS
jgi:signal peptidase II